MHLRWGLAKDPTLFCGIAVPVGFHLSSWAPAITSTPKSGASDSVGPPSHDVTLGKKSINLHGIASSAVDH